MNSTERLIFDDLNMIIKDESGKEFIADVTPRLNNSSGYVTQCNIAQRMVQCYNEFPFNHFESPYDVKNRNRELQVEVDVLTSKNLQLVKQANATDESIRLLTDKCADLSRAKTRLTGEVHVLTTALQDIYKSLNDSLENKNKSAANLKMDVRRIIDYMETEKLAQTEGGADE